LALLAGRKLLLADDSITIQKVVALTFADEGVEVVTVSDGREAIEQLQVITPDVVLADVFMPEVNGYEVCSHIKQNAQLKHIPVMLLVGSFEPFDEAEARRVGADDILTKPFQSIRRLIDKVGGLVHSKPPDEATTAELPHVQAEAAEPEKLSTAELEITTADTQRLPVAEKLPEYPASEPAADVIEHQEIRSSEPVVKAEPPQDVKPAILQESQIMDSPGNELRNENALDQGDVLLELGDISRTPIHATDDFVLDLDFEEPQTAPAFESVALSGTSSFVEPQMSRPSDAPVHAVQAEPSSSTGWMDTSELAYRQHGLPAITEESTTATDQRFADTQEWMRESTSPATVDSPSKEQSGRLERVIDEPSVAAPIARPAGPLRLDQVSPEVIDAIARRAVEQLSARVIQEIAWEVVPELAELMIKRKLEENQSQPK
jgi:CheY-like chemotaxis protein